MAEVRVRWAMVCWSETDPGTGRRRERTAGRGEVVDIPDERAARLKAEGAVVDPEVELDRPGTLVALAGTPSDLELVSWVANATTGELQELARHRPDLFDRLEDARAAVLVQAQERDALLGRVTAQVAELGERPAPKDPAVADSGPGGEPATLDDVVKGSVGAISDYLSRHPGDAQAVLDAETEARDGDPRPGVVRACQVAIAHTAV